MVAEKTATDFVYETIFLVFNTSSINYVKVWTVFSSSSTKSVILYKF